ncbi:hypothetical protein FTX61_00295 [Nitriliruptoraceae bacterium ZYF776]|nr:hypothetical protein [Profundirhabdus halotolerans]
MRSHCAQRVAVPPRRVLRARPRWPGSPWAVGGRALGPRRRWTTRPAAAGTPHRPPRHQPSGSPVRPRRRHVLPLLLALTALLVVPVAPSFATEVAPPATVTATVADLPAASDAPAPDEDLPAELDGVDDPDVSGTVATAVRFSTLGVRLPVGVEAAQVRTRSSEDGSWGPWLELELALPGLDGPDPGSPEAAAAATDLTEPAWVGPSDAFQVALDGDLADVEVELVDTLGQDEGLVAKVVRHLTPRVVAAPAEATAGRPSIISRRSWGADESWRRGSPRYATPRLAVLHHTAGANTYTRDQAAAVVRGIYNYHARTLGWGDVGYNVLVDRYGRIYEGRAGGLDRGVIGAHAAGFNTGTFGVAAMGNFDVQDVPGAVLESVAAVVAWKYDVHGIDASASRTTTLNDRRLAVLTTHRDVGNTACPGRYLYAKMGQLRARVEALAGGARSSAVPASRFADVPRGHTHHDSIEIIAVRDITAGCAPRRYCPAASVTRAQMASFLTRALELPAVPGQPFRDASGPHGDAIARLSAAGVTTGCAPGRFCPNDPVTRGQMATFLARAFELPRVPSSFRDVRDGDPHGPAIGGLAAAGIAGGYGDGTYRPAAPVSRAEMAAFLARALAPARP